MEYREKILALAKTQPLLPAGVAKALGTNGIMAGAMLSEMCSKGLLKTSALKVGGSPLYYIPGNEQQLLNHLQSINEKDRRTVLLLQEQKLLREQEQDPLTRVSLAQIKDFAIPLVVTYSDTQEKFYKWFTLTDKEAEELIRQKLEPTPVPTVSEKQNAPKPAKTKPARTEAVEQKTLSDTQSTPAPAPLQPSGEFWDRITAFLSQNSITLTESSQKKKTEFELIVALPSPVGNLAYFCKAHSKKKISDADLSSAYVAGQLRKLPIIFLTDGELTKPAQELLAKLNGLTVKKL